jgi:hypothetical protein
MSSGNIKLGFVTITLLNGSSTQAYIREYDTINGTSQARTIVSGVFIQAQWNGLTWIQVQG